MSILFMRSLSSVDAYHVRRRRPRLLAVHLEGTLCLVPCLADGTRFPSLGRRVCLIIPFWMFLMGWHGVFAFSSGSLFVSYGYSAARCSRVYLFPRLGLLGSWSQTVLYVRLDLTWLIFHVLLSSAVQ